MINAEKLGTILIKGFRQGLIKKIVQAQMVQISLYTLKSELQKLKKLGFPLKISAEYHFLNSPRIDNRTDKKNAKTQQV